MHILHSSLMFMAKWYMWHYGFFKYFQSRYHAVAQTLPAKNTWRSDLWVVQVSLGFLWLNLIETSRQRLSKLSEKAATALCSCYLPLQEELGSVLPKLGALHWFSQFSKTLLELGAPKVNRVFQMWPHRGWTDNTTYIQSASYSPRDVVKCTVFLIHAICQWLLYKFFLSCWNGGWVSTEMSISFQPIL